MIQNENTFDLFLKNIDSPVLVLSTKVGRGVFSVGEAIEEKLLELGKAVRHESIEDFSPQDVVREDLERYKWISNKHPFLLKLIYKFPPIYFRKYLRARYLGNTSDFQALQKLITELRPRTVISASHRPTFWVSYLKWKHGFHFHLAGLSIELGNSLGWRYLFWNQIDRLLIPFSPNLLDPKIPRENLKIQEVALPARKIFSDIAGRSGDKNKVLLVCGYWGQGPFERIISDLLESFPQLNVHVVTGENQNSFVQLNLLYGSHPRVKVYGALNSIAPLLEACAAIITKPGISTILEGFTARRKIFLIKGMPVAEDNNARHATQYFGAQAFSIKAFGYWYKTAAPSSPLDHRGSGRELGL
ncbi:MAG: hypothetical protein K2X47_07525 [Bdellovibrionales bacterium]|nr:hypothetical protein [Bdellovibrionales bacterium]